VKNIGMAICTRDYIFSSMHDFVRMAKNEAESEKGKKDFHCIGYFRMAIFSDPFVLS